MSNVSGSSATFPPPPNVEAVPAADVSLPVAPTDYRNASYLVKRPADEIEEFFVECRATTLTRCRKKLEQIAGSKFPIYEMLLAISALALGGWLGALASEITLAGSGMRGIFFFAILPVIGTASGIAYILLRAGSVKESAEVAQDILRDLPDPKTSK